MHIIVLMLVNDVNVSPYYRILPDSYSSRW